MSTTLSTKRILITGGSRGIGYSIAYRFASLGASIVLLSKNASLLSEARSSLPKIPGRDQSHTMIVGDVGDPDLWEEVKRHEKDIEILVNAAGTAHYSLLVGTKTETIEQVVRTNLLGTVLGCRAVGKNMIRRKSGCIINISSVLGLHKQTPGNSVYAATKAGVIGLTRTLAAELGPAGVRTNAIVPGYIKTDMTAGMTEDSKEKALKATPLGRLGRVDEIADTAVFLAESGFINGAEIVVDGGLRCS